MRDILIVSSMVLYNLYTNWHSDPQRSLNRMGHLDQAEFQKMLDDPSASFKTPEAVLDDNRLSREQKIQVLKQWAYDVREMEVAEGENMRGDSSSLILHQILLVLHQVEH